MVYGEGLNFKELWMTIAFAIATLGSLLKFLKLLSANLLNSDVWQRIEQILTEELRMTIFKQWYSEGLKEF